MSALIEESMSALIEERDSFATELKKRVVSMI